MYIGRVEPIHVGYSNTQRADRQTARQTERETDRQTDRYRQTER